MIKIKPRATLTLYSLLFSGFASAKPPTFNPNWFACKTDSECIIAKGTCNQPTSVNEKFKNEAEAYYIFQGYSIRCRRAPIPEVLRVHCLQNKCTADFKPAAQELKKNKD